MRLLSENEWTCAACGDRAHGELEGSDCLEAAVHDECHVNLMRQSGGCPHCHRKEGTVHFCPNCPVDHTGARRPLLLDGGIRCHGCGYSVKEHA